MADVGLAAAWFCERPEIVTLAAVIVSAVWAVAAYRRLAMSCCPVLACFGYTTLRMETCGRGDRFTQPLAPKSHLFAVPCPPAVRALPFPRLAQALIRLRA